MLDCERGKNRIFIRIIAFITAQVFLLTSLGYSGPNIYNRNISSSYIDTKGLRVPMMGSLDNGRLTRAMDRAAGIISEDAFLDTETTAVSFTKLVSSLRNHIGKTGSSFYENIKGRILNGERPIAEEDKIGNISNVSTLGTFIDEHFALPEEAVREIITNAYDSMHGELSPEEREVLVKLADHFLSVSDPGSGMSLDTILKKFLLPFEGGKTSDILSHIKDIIDDKKPKKILRIKQFLDFIEASALSDTEKLTISDIQRQLGEESIDEAQRLNVIKNIVTFTGRFGIGFYSLLYFLKTDKDYIEIVTSTGQEAHRIRFFKRNGELQTAITVLNPSELTRGTTVILRSQSFDKNNAQRVIDQFLSFNTNAKISVSIDGMAPKVINEEVFNPGRFEHISDDSQVEVFYSRAKNTSGKTTVYINVHGVTIMTKQVDGLGMPETVVFNFPANIGLPISRNKILVNELFIEKAKDMIYLIASKPELLSAFFPCIEALESSAKASYRNILVSAAADAAYSLWSKAGLVYLPNEQEYSKVSHAKVVLVDRKLLKMVMLRGFSNNYAIIGKPLRTVGLENVTIGTKRVYFADFIDETKFVATSDVILINRKHIPETDSDKALYNVLLKLTEEKGRFEYTYQSQALAVSGIGQELASGYGESRPSVTEKDSTRIQDIVNSLPDERSKMHFMQILRVIQQDSYYLQKYIDDPEIFLDIYKRLVDSRLIDIPWAHWTQFYKILSWRILKNEGELKIIFENERIRKLQGYFTEKGRPELTIALIIAFTENFAYQGLSEAMKRKIWDRLWEERELFNELARLQSPWINICQTEFFVSAILLDEDTYEKFKEKLFAEIDKVHILGYGINDILIQKRSLELFFEGSFAAIKRINDICDSLKETFQDDTMLYDYAGLAISMKNMSNDEIRRFISAGIEKRQGQVLRFSVIGPVLPQYLRFFYGENWPNLFGDYFDNNSNSSEINILESIMKSGLLIQEKKRFLEAITQAGDMLHDYHESRPTPEGYIRGIGPKEEPGFPFDFTSEELAQIQNPALFAWFAYSIKPFDANFLSRKYSLEKQGEDALSGYDYELRYKKELLSKVIVIFRHISNLPNNEFYAACNDFKEYFSKGKMTSRIEPYVQYLLNSQDARDIAGNEIDVKAQRKFTLVDLYDTFLGLSPEEEKQEELAGTKGDFAYVDRRIESVAQTIPKDITDMVAERGKAPKASLKALIIRVRRKLSRRQESETPMRQLTEERQKLLRNTFRAAAQQSVDDLVMIREVVQNVLDETPLGAKNQKVSINTYRKILKTLEGEEELTVIDIEDTIGMNEERFFNKLLMPFSSSKKDPEKFLGKQGQGFFTLLANSEYVVIKTIWNGKVIILKVTPERLNGQVVDFHVEEEKREALAGEKNGTRMQAFIKSALPGLEAARVSFAGQKFASLVDSDRLAVEVDGRQINLNKDRRIAVEKSLYGDIEFYSIAGESFMALGGLFVKPLDDEFLALMPPALRPILLQHGFAMNLPFQRIRRIQGGSDIANREDVYKGIEDAVVLGTMKLVIAMFAQGDLPSLSLLGDEYYDWAYDKKAAQDAQDLMNGTADIDYIRTKYFLPNSTNRLAKLLLAVPIDFLEEIFGRPLSLAELFYNFKRNRSMFDEAVMEKLPKPIKDVLNKIEDDEKKIELQHAAAKELGIPEELISNAFIALPKEQGEGMAAYWAFLEMSDIIARIGIETMLKENSGEALGDIQERLEYLRDNPARSHYYAEANGLSMAHAQQGGSEYAWNLLEQKEHLKLFYQYLSKQISLPEFLDKAFEDIIGTLSHELIHILEQSAEGTHNDVFLKRQKLMVSAMISARNYIAATLIDIRDNGQYANNLRDIEIKNLLEYVVRSRTETIISVEQVVISMDMESVTSKKDVDGSQPDTASSASLAAQGIEMQRNVSSSL